MQTYDWRWVQAQARKTSGVWNRCRGVRPAHGTRFSSDSQNKREAAYDAALEAVEDELKITRTTTAERSAMRERVIAAFGRFSASALDLEPDAIDLLTKEFLPVGTGLAQWARRFDPELAMPDIIQACRNAWTACGLQPLLGERVEITPAILGYSLLYPYSDNYLDEQNVSAQAKLHFSQRFRERLRGESIHPLNQRECALWRLIELIEEQFERRSFPQVYNCLLSIHRAQEQSVRQLRTQGPYSEIDTIRMSCEKGGSSVLADACLANGWLSETEATFAFEWGVLLQLGDDLQDVHDDLRRGSMTLFSHAAAVGEPLDGLTVQLLRFAEHVGEQMDGLRAGSGMLKRLLKMSWHSLIIRAVADSEQYFSKAFVKEAERYSPFRFDFLRRRQQRVAAQHGLYGMMFEAFIEDDVECLGSLPAPHHRENWAAQADVDPAAVAAVLE
ncbi:MAG: hypothetical protein JO051_04320 [Acidobacteriaceae bacterium]|nr:hypothetical protein [Acidobacteriaceae bacterium]